MRAVCERCEARQPTDWLSGDLCVACSGAVRREERCFWCNGWSPAGSFCRACGAERVGDESYGAARMLLRTGADMFSIPKLVREMDPGRLAVFASQYAQQRALVSRHVEDLLFVETFLIQRGFAMALEEQLIAGLPWTPVQLAPMAAASSSAPDGLQRLCELEERSPIAETRELATIARLWARDWTAFRAVARMSGDAPGSPAEATLAATWWRCATALSLNRAQLPLEALARLPFPAEVAVRLGAMGRPADPQALADAAVSRDPDLAFAAALATRNLPALQTALGGDEEMQRAASHTLASMRNTELLASWFPLASPAAQRDVIGALQHDKSGRAGPLTGSILRAMESAAPGPGPGDSLRTSCGIVLARGATLDVALRVAELSRGAIYVVQALVAESAGLAPHETAQALAILAGHGWLKAGSYGIEEASKRGAIPDTFVPAVFPSASDETRLELCRIAEQQLGARHDPALHAFLLQTVFGPFDAKVRAAAWWSLSRGYARERHGWFGPLTLSPESIAAFFPSVPAFLTGFTAVLGDYLTLKEVGLFDFLQRLTHGLDAAKVQALKAFDCHAFVEAMRAASRLDVWSPLRDSLTRAVALFEAA